MKKDLLERLRLEGNPLIDSETVTFLWQGESAPQLIDDLHGWEDNPQRLKRIGTDSSAGSELTLWAFSFPLARDAYLEYSFYDPISKNRTNEKTPGTNQPETQAEKHTPHCTLAWNH